MAKLFNFTSINITPQSDETKSFGVKSVNKFRLTSSFDLSADTSAYSMMAGTILLQQQSGDTNKVNLILKPIESQEIKFAVKYVIYRGLKISDFLTSADITNTNTTVKTTGTELLDAMQIIQQQRASGDDIPVEALFGNDLSPASTKNIDEFFFQNSAPSSQLFSINGGIELGNFGVGEVGIEIILNNPEFFQTVAMAGVSFYEIDVTGVTDPLEKSYKKEQIRHFMDVPAFYGTHHNIEGGIEYRSNTGDKELANTSNLVYEKLLIPFATKNKVYLDIRNENGYSYNYYGNYIGTGLNANKEIQTGAGAGSLSPKEYYTGEWPLHIVDVITPSTTETSNVFFISLRVNDNEKPLLAGLSENMISGIASDEDQKIKFLDEAFLTPNPSPLPEYTEAIELSVANYLSGGAGTQIGTYLKLDYFKQIRLSDGTDTFPKVNSTDHLFGPISTNIPWNSSNRTQWITSQNYPYYDGLNNGITYGAIEEPITAIDIALKTITVGSTNNGGITNQVKITNPTNNQNVGAYNVVNVEIVGSDTVITVRESFSSGLQTGDTLVFNVEASVTINYVTKELTANSIDLTTSNAFDIGKGVWLYTKKGDKPQRYTVSSRSLLSGNTVITVSEDIAKEGFAAITETGMVSENNPLDADRILFYAAPQNYFQKTGIKDTNFFNYKGATNNDESFIGTLQKLAPDFRIEKFNLQPMAGQFVVTLGYPEETVSKENLLLLGMSQTEFESLQTVAAAQLSPYHIQQIKLVPQGNRLRDEDYEIYYKYHAVVSGLDTNGDYAEATPTTPVSIYTRDQLVFTSEAYANSEELNSSELNYEETFHLSAKYNAIPIGGSTSSTFMHLYETVGSELKSIVDNFKIQIDALNTSNFLNNIEGVILSSGTNLLATAKTKIRLTGDSLFGKDGALYLARLQMRKAFKEHILVSSGFVSISRIESSLELIEKVTRGLHESNAPNFTSHPSHIPILISGYDPFISAFPRAPYYDEDFHMSNPSGNIALALDNTVISDGSANAIIKSAVFPVRFKEFDDGWVEDFFDPYINPNHPEFNTRIASGNPVKMIITFSYYSDRYKFQIDRFSSRHRGLGTPDNNGQGAEESNYLLNSDKNDFEFIETGLPYNDLYIDNQVNLHQKAKFHYYNGSVPASLQLYGPKEYGVTTLVGFPNITNYPPPSGIIADRVKANQGSGGDYLSNEIYYRVSFLRQEFNPLLKTGHIHVSYLRSDPGGIRGDRAEMLSIITQAIQQTLSNL